MHRDFGNVTLECIKGDITAQPDMAIIVNAANSALAGGGGVDGAIHRAAGPKLVQASQALGPIDAGQAVITPAFDLANDWVIHCVGPVYRRDAPVAEQLAGCYRQALALAEDRQAGSIAFPAISAGVYGYPMHEAARIAVTTVAGTAPTLSAVKRVRFVLFSDEALAAFDEALGQI